MSVNMKANGTTHTLLEKSDIFNMLYPVGSVYFSRSGTGLNDTKCASFKCPLATYGGTWQLCNFGIATDLNTQQVIDLASGSSANGTNAQIYNSNCSRAQKWWLSLWRWNYRPTTAQGIYPDTHDSKHGYLLAWVRTA